MWTQRKLFRVRLPVIPFHCRMQFRLTFSLTGCGLWNSPLNQNNDNRQNNSSVRWRENYRRTGITPFIFIYQTFPYIVWKGYGTAGA